MGQRLRLEAWPRHLHELIEAASARPFAWGSHDCCTFAAACVEAVTGQRLWPTGLGLYQSETGAARAIRRAGASDIRDLFDRILGDRQPPKRARRGDLVAIDEAGHPAAAVVDLTGEFAVSVSPKGLCRVPLAQATAAWLVD